MKRIPCAFRKDPQTGLATLQPAVSWFAEGYGLATRKWDGIPFLLAKPDDEEAYLFYKGFRSGIQAEWPKRTIITSDDGEEVTGWMPVSPSNQWFMQILQHRAETGKPFSPGGYELCGPNVKGNPEGLEADQLLEHSLVSYLYTPRQLDDLIAFMCRIDPGEGIVWQYGGELCQVTRRDVGLPWPVAE